MEQENKKSFFSNLLVAILCVLIALIAVGFIIYNKKEPANDESGITNKNSENVFNGLYKNGISNILLYEEENIVYYATSLNYPNIHSLGKLKKEGNKATGNLVITLNDNSIIVQNDSILEGTYTKEKNITFEDYWNVGYGDSKLFDSNYNGKYSVRGGSITIYQSDDQYARVLIDFEKEKIAHNFYITEFGSLTYYSQDYKYNISYSKDSNDKLIIIKQKTETDEVEYEYVANKKSSVSKKDILNMDIEYK